MRFTGKSPLRNPTNPLVEVLGQGVTRTFAAAWDKYPQGDKRNHAVATARTWVSDVFEVFALRTDIPKAQLVHAFCSNDYLALQRTFDKRAAALQAAILEIKVPELKTKMLKELTELNKVREMAQVDFVNSIRSVWVDSLGITASSTTAGRARRVEMEGRLHTKASDPATKSQVVKEVKHRRKAYPEAKSAKKIEHAQQAAKVFVGA